MIWKSGMDSNWLWFRFGYCDQGIELYLEYVQN